MLTADLVEVRRRGDELFVRPLAEEERAAALGLAETYAGLVRAHIGSSRAELGEALRAVPVPGRHKKLGAGLAKLALDTCQFEQAAGLDPAAVRAALFARATSVRKQLAPGASFERAAVVAEVAAQLGGAPADVEASLYADLPEAQVLVSADLRGGAELFAAWESGGVQAILLRAVKVQARLTGARPAAYRALFRKLKFLRLLHQIQPLPPGKDGTSPGYEITIDGPYSMFESVTRYGLQLALAYPALTSCGRYSIEAELRWGKERRALRFVQRGPSPQPSATGVGDLEAAYEAPLPSEVAALLEELQARAGDSGFRAMPSQQLLALPGAGVIAPDLELTELATGRRVHVEVLGFWSRDAVWRRIDLASRGLPEPVIFAASKHLRVSEAALPDNSGAALYVYANKLSPRALLDRAQQLLRDAPASDDR